MEPRIKKLASQLGKTIHKGTVLATAHHLGSAKILKRKRKGIGLDYK